MKKPREIDASQFQKKAYARVNANGAAQPSARVNGGGVLVHRPLPPGIIRPSTATVAKLAGMPEPLTSRKASPVVVGKAAKPCGGDCGCKPCKDASTTRTPIAGRAQMDVARARVEPQRRGYARVDTKGRAFRNGGGRDG